MATVQIFNYIESHRALVEYRGNAGDVVLLNAFVTPAQSFRFRDAPLGYLRGEPLVNLRDKLFTENISTFQIIPTRTLQADSNGVAHWLLETSGLSAGATLRVETTTLI